MTSQRAIPRAIAIAVLLASGVAACATPSTPARPSSGSAAGPLAPALTATLTSTPQPTAAPIVTATATPAATPTPVTTTVAMPLVQRQLVRHGFEIVARYPHDRAAFTQGLIFHQGKFFESTGLKGRSSLREVEIETGRVLRKVDVAPQYFAEGLALVNGELLQLTWQESTGFVYDLATFQQKRTWSYAHEGWGIAYDGASLVVSDGTSELRFLDPVTLAPIRSVTVTLEGQPQQLLNELEWIDGTLWANVWQTTQIVQIDPASGQVIGTLDLGALLSQLDRSQPIDVLNGIAYDPASKRLFVTGKLWPEVFEIRLK
jgi:glutaminyl-peptide cyclotransferase